MDTTGCPKKVALDNWKLDTLDEPLTFLETNLLYSPSLFMPICRHFLSLQAWHWLRCALSMVHAPFPAWHLIMNQIYFTKTQKCLKVTCISISFELISWRILSTHYKQGFHNVFQNLCLHKRNKPNLIQIQPNKEKKLKTTVKTDIIIVFQMGWLKKILLDNWKLTFERSKCSISCCCDSDGSDTCGGDLTLGPDIDPNIPSPGRLELPANLLSTSVKKSKKI